MMNEMRETFVKWEQAAEALLAADRAAAEKTAGALSQAQKILIEAASNIDNRAAERDTEAERSMARAVAIFNAYSGHTLTETDGWMFMVCLKMARSRAGKFRRDDYTDLSAYAALAGECEMERSG